jgi:hypothetical protein
VDARCHSREQVPWADAAGNQWRRHVTTELLHGDDGDGTVTGHRFHRHTAISSSGFLTSFGTLAPGVG